MGEILKIMPVHNRIGYPANQVEGICHHWRQWSCWSWCVLVSFLLLLLFLSTRPKPESIIICEEGTSAVKMPPSDLPVGEYKRQFQLVEGPSPLWVVPPMGR